MILVISDNLKTTAILKDNEELKRLIKASRHDVNTDSISIMIEDKDYPQVYLILIECGIPYWRAE